MTFGLTSTGFKPKRYADILPEKEIVGILRDGNYWRKPQLLERPYEHANRVYVFADLDQGTGLP